MKWMGKQWKKITIDGRTAVRREWESKLTIIKEHLIKSQLISIYYFVETIASCDVYDNSINLTRSTRRLWDVFLSFPLDFCCYSNIFRVEIPIKMIPNKLFSLRFIFLISWERRRFIRFHCETNSDASTLLYFNCLSTKSALSSHHPIQTLRLNGEWD